jgi:alkylated DNA nucleotide flippase Atl1
VQIHLLEEEGVALTDGRVDLSKYLWDSQQV